MWKRTPFGVYSQVEIDYVETPDPKIHHRYPISFVRKTDGSKWFFDGYIEKWVQLSPEEEALERLLLPCCIDEDRD